MGIQNVSEINWFKVLIIFISYLIAILLIAAICSLFFLTSFEDVFKSLQSREMRYSLKLSAITSIISTILVMFFAVIIAYAISRFSFFGDKIVKTIINLPIAFPELVLGLCLLQLFSSGPVAVFLKKAGLNFIFTRQGIIAAQFFTALPYTTRIMKSTFDYVSRKIEFVSWSLGYSPLSTFLNVTIPLARKGLVASVVISFARCIGAFGSVLILAGGSYMKTDVLPVSLYLNISYGNMPMALTSGMLLVVISFISIYIFERADIRA